jgi:hypothetical protein
MALQSRLDEPFWHVSSDQFVAAGMLPPHRDGVEAFDGPRPLDVGHRW